MKFEKRIKRIPVSFDDETINALEVIAEMERRPVTEVIFLMVREKLFGLADCLPIRERVE